MPSSWRDLFRPSASSARQRTRRRYLAIGAVSVVVSVVALNAGPVSAVTLSTLSGFPPPIQGHAKPVSDRDSLAQGCADVLFVGLRGSGEKKDFGDTIKPIAKQV